MSAIFKREFKAFFTNPIGYVVLAVLYAVSGAAFYFSNLLNHSADLTGVFVALFYITLLAAPFMTMRLFSEEKKQKTDQALFTAPASLTGIVLGKFFAAMLLYICAVSITLVYLFIIALKVSPAWLVFVGNYVGLLLVGGLIIAIGIFISALTESQLIASLGTLAISLVLMCVDLLGNIFASFGWVKAITDFLSISTRYNDFTLGLIQYDNIIFFLTMQALFLFLTVRVLDSKRWN